MISDAIVESRQKLTSMSLTTTQLLSWHEILKIFVICDHFNKVNKVFKLWLSFLESANNNHKFFIIDFIITLNWIMLLQKVSDWMKNLILIILRKNVFEYIVQSIDFYYNFVIWIIMIKNNLESEDFLKNIKCNLTFLKSDKKYIFSDETSELSELRSMRIKVLQRIKNRHKNYSSILSLNSQMKIWVYENRDTESTRISIIDSQRL